ncbi:MAG: metallophosphoesterase [Clostridia bacterium]|nr:metallophosphoesterase [Clostridia bacterium]
MATFSERIISFFMSILAFFSALSLPGLNAPARIEYAFSDAQSGCAGGTVTVSAKMPGEYTLYWGDGDARKLSAVTGAGSIPYSEFGAVTVTKGAGAVSVYHYTAIPEGAETVLAYQGKTFRGSASIPAEKQTRSSDLQYSFGALSDVHFNRYNASGSGDDACIAFRGALDFLKKCDVDFVAITGDIGNSGEEDSLQKYDRIVSDYDFPIYTCTGNHDVGFDHWQEWWLRYANRDVYGNPGRSDIELAANGLDFVYKPDVMGGDVCIFLSQRYWDYNKATSRLLDDDQLDWLAEKLDAYADRRVYLCFHTFMSDANNDPRTGEGNLVNNRGFTYDLVYTVGTPDETRMRSLLKEHKNVVFFNGHSHWDFDSYTLNEQTNITSYGGQYATFVHVPSVSSPRSITKNAFDKTEMNMKSSQGYLVRVYEDRIELTGMEFIGTTCLAYATYRIDR